jgi:hypothetical protein
MIKPREDFLRGLALGRETLGIAFAGVWRRIPMPEKKPLEARYGVFRQSLIKGSA